MHINRQRLLEISLHTLDTMRTHKVKVANPCGKTAGHTTWEDVIDMDFVNWLTKEIVMLDPKENCELVGSRANWIGLDRNKSLFYTADGCGMPIGNLTSQLFSNVYLNELDQYMKRELHCKHYGRYVDDAYIVSSDRDWMLSLVPDIRQFLKSRLGLDLHMGKLCVCDSKSGVEFLGSYVKPYRNYVSNQSLRRMRNNIMKIDFTDPAKVLRTVNSYLGMMVHYASYNLRKELFMRSGFLLIAPYDDGMTKMMNFSAAEPQNTVHLIKLKNNEQVLWYF
jgi:hypothetical protein